MGSSDHMKRLYAAIGTDNNFQACGISLSLFAENTTVFAFVTERISSRGAGYNLSHGQLLRVHFSGVGDGADNHATKACCALRSEFILDGTASGAIVHQ